MSQPDTPTLLMIYNADGGLMNGALDLLHKWISPSTYACDLCAITYDTLGMKKPWRQTIESLPMPVRFLHRDEWLAERPGDRTALPTILLHHPDGALQPVITARDFAALADLQQLRSLLLDRLGLAPEGQPARQ